MALISWLVPFFLEHKATRKVFSALMKKSDKKCVGISQFLPLFRYLVMEIHPNKTFFLNINIQ
jgi:hypothetical protein